MLPKWIQVFNSLRYFNQCFKETLLGNLSVRFIFTDLYCVFCRGLHQVSGCKELHPVSVCIGLHQVSGCRELHPVSVCIELHQVSGRWASLSWRRDSSITYLNVVAFMSVICRLILYYNFCYKNQLYTFMKLYTSNNSTC